MALNLVSLDSRTREFMLEELEQDISQNKLYRSPRLSDIGVRNYDKFLRDAIRTGDDVSLANALAAPSVMSPTERKQKPRGGFTIAKVPRTAPETLSEGEFNRFYVRGLCRRAITEGIDELEIYRAKPVRAPRPQSEAMIGHKVKAQRLLHDLRTNIGVDTALGVPAGPNSGLSIRLP